MSEDTLTDANDKKPSVIYLVTFEDGTSVRYGYKDAAERIAKIEEVPFLSLVNESDFNNLQAKKEAHIKELESRYAYSKTQIDVCLKEVKDLERKYREEKTLANRLFSLVETTEGFSKMHEKDSKLYLGILSEVLGVIEKYKNIPVCTDNGDEFLADALLSKLKSVVK